MTSEPQDATEHDEPNEHGFAGGATTPTPEPGAKEGFGEQIAVPAGDITGALMAAIDNAGHHNDEARENGRENAHPDNDRETVGPAAAREDAAHEQDREN